MVVNNAKPANANARSLQIRQQVFTERRADMDLLNHLFAKMQLDKKIETT